MIRQEKTDLWVKCKSLESPLPGELGVGRGSSLLQCFSLCWGSLFRNKGIRPQDPHVSIWQHWMLFASLFGDITLLAAVTCECQDRKDFPKARVTVNGKVRRGRVIRRLQEVSPPTTNVTLYAVLGEHSLPLGMVPSYTRTAECGS